MELLKLLSTNEIVAQLISFLLLFTLLRVFVWKRLLKLLDERKQRIDSEFSKINAAKVEIEKLKSDYEAKLGDIERIGSEKIQEALAQGRLVSEERIKGANLEAQEIINSAKADIKYELAKAKEELKEKIIELTISATENVIREKLTGENDKKLIGEFLEKIDGLE